jgi:hypothetical protein
VLSGQVVPSADTLTTYHDPSGSTIDAVSPPAAIGIWPEADMSDTQSQPVWSPRVMHSPETA